MTSLATCIKRAGKALTKQDAEAIKEIMAEGGTAQEAVDEYLTVLAEEHASLMAEVEAVAGEAIDETLLPLGGPLRMEDIDLIDDEKLAAMDPRFPGIQRRFAEYVTSRPWTEVVDEYRSIGEWDTNLDEQRQLRERLAGRGITHGLNSPEDTQRGRINSVDSWRELSDDYRNDRSVSAAIHEVGSALSKKLYYEFLAEAPIGGLGSEYILFTSGGTGVAKTSGLGMSEHARGAAMVFDGNLAKVPSGQKKIDAALASGRLVKIVHTIREPIEALRNGAVTRAMRQEKKHGTGRPVPLDGHVGTNVGASNGIRELNEIYRGDPRLAYEYVDNTNGKGGMVLGTIDSVLNLDYNEKFAEAKEALQEIYENGHPQTKGYPLSTKLYYAFRNEPIPEGAGRFHRNFDGYVEADQGATEGVQGEIGQGNRGHYSRGEPQGDGALPRVRRAELQLSLAPAIRALVGTARTNIVQTTDELPPSVDPETGELLITPSDAEGMWRSPDGRDIWLVADNLPTVERAKKVFAHEAFGHLAMEAQPEFQDVLASVKNLLALNNKAFTDAAEKISITQGNLNEDNQAKEILAYMAENGIENGTIGRAIAAVRGMLRRMGLLDGANYSEAEIKALLVRAARDIVSGAEAKQKALAAMPVQEQILNDPDAVADAVYNAINEVYANGTLMDRAMAELAAGDTASVQHRANMSPKVLPDVISPEALYSVAYHGTAAMFNKFDMNYMGTGEGWQAYGWGMYFSTKRAIAEWYQRQRAGGMTYSYGERTDLTGQDALDAMSDDMTNTLLSQNIAIEEAARVGPEVAAAAIGMYNRHNGDTSKVRTELEQQRENYLRKAEVGQNIWDDDKKNNREIYWGARGAYKLIAYDRATAEAFDRAIELVTQRLEGVPRRGNLMEVEVPDEGLLDYDKRMGEQPEILEKIPDKMQDAIMAANPNLSTAIADMRGGQFYGYLGNYLRAEEIAARVGGVEKGMMKMLPSLMAMDGLSLTGSDKLASLYLKEQGIPGHSFVGRTSDEANYLIYDDAAVQINKINDTAVENLFSRAPSYAEHRAMTEIMRLRDATKRVTPNPADAAAAQLGTDPGQPAGWYWKVSSEAGTRAFAQPKGSWEERYYTELGKQASQAAVAAVPPPAQMTEQQALFSQSGPTKKMTVNRRQFLIGMAATATAAYIPSLPAEISKAIKTGRQPSIDSYWGDKDVDTYYRALENWQRSLASGDSVGAKTALERAVREGIHIAEYYGWEPPLPDAWVVQQAEAKIRNQKMMRQLRETESSFEIGERFGHQEEADDDGRRYNVASNKIKDRALYSRMNRREFLEGLAAAAITAATPQITAPMIEAAKATVTHTVAKETLTWGARFKINDRLFELTGWNNKLGGTSGTVRELRDSPWVERLYKGPLTETMPPDSMPAYEFTGKSVDEVIPQALKTVARNLAVKEVMSQHPEYFEEQQRSGEVDDDGRIRGATSNRIGERGMYSRKIHSDPEIERIRDKVLSPALEDYTVKDRVRDLVNRVRGIEWLSIKQGIVDSSASVEELEKGIYGKVQDASLSPHKAILSTRNLGSVMAAIMHRGIPIYQNGVFTARTGRQGLIQIFEKITHHEAGNMLPLWELYAAAKRSQRLITEKNPDGTSKEKNFTQDEINKALTLEAQYPEFKTAFLEWQKFNSQLLDLAIKQGVINGDEAKIWRQNDYVPFYRAMEEIEYEGGQGQQTGRSGVANVRSGIKRLTGKAAPIGNVFENMVMNTAYLTDAIYRNTAMQRVAAMADGIAMHKVPMAFEAIRFSDADLARALMKAGLIVGNGTSETDMFNDGIRQVGAMTAAQKEHWSVLFRRVAPRGPNIVSVLMEGKPVYYEVDDPLLLRSIDAIGAQQAGGIMNTFRFAKRVLTKAVTIDPAFMMANFLRDTLSTAVVVKGSGAKQVLGALKGLKAAFNEDEEIMAMMMAGAGGGGFYDHNPADVRKMLAKKMPAGKVNSFANSIITPRGAYRAWQKIGNASEQANRVAIFKRIIAEGGTVAEAAYQARDVLNFTMAGDYAAMKFLVQTVPFLNARVQGLYRLYRGGKENPVGFAMKGLTITAATMALLLKNLDDDRYKELPEWDKDIYWHFFVGDEHLRLPKPFEVGALFATVFERAYMLGTGDDNLDITVERGWRMVLDTFAFNPVPQAIKPIIEQYSNRNMFTGNPIIGLAHEGMKPESQYDPWTSETMRELAKILPGWGGSPKRLESFMRGYFGAAGMYALGASDAVTRRAFGHPERPTKGIRNYPVLTRFWRDPTPRTSKYSSQLYDMLGEADAIYKTMKAYRDQSRISEAAAMMKDNRGKLAARAFLHDVSNDVRDINHRMRRVQYSNRSAAEKRTEIDKLNAIKIKTMARVAKVSDIF